MKNGFTFPRWNEKRPCPADIYAADQHEQRYFFEIKKTKIIEKKRNLFGAASLSEWTAAMENQGRYFFVLAIEKDESEFDFYVIKPETFMTYSIVPSFKIYFNIPVENTNNKLQFSKPGRNKGTIIMNSKVYNRLKSFWEDISQKMSSNGQDKEITSNDFKIIDQSKYLLEQLEFYLRAK